MTNTPNILDKVRVVLVEPQGPLNIGSACRAMKNFGLSKLILVRPGCKLGLQAVKMAMHAKDILDSVKIVETIPEAIKGSVLVLGTANRRGEYHEPNFTVQEGMQRIAEYIPDGDITIMFGREEWGLKKEDLKFAQGTMRVVTNPECSSLNLSQAVLLVSYELYQYFGTPPLPNLAEKKSYVNQPPTTEELNRLFAHMKSVLTMCEFLPKTKPDSLFQVIRGFFHRSKPARREINILMGIFSNVEGFMKKFVKKKRK